MIGNTNRRAGCTGQTSGQMSGRFRGSVFGEPCCLLELAFNFYFNFNLRPIERRAHQMKRVLSRRSWSGASKWWPFVGLHLVRPIAPIGSKLGAKWEQIEGKTTGCRPVAVIDLGLPLRARDLRYLPLGPNCSGGSIKRRLGGSNSGL